MLKALSFFTGSMGLDLGLSLCGIEFFFTSEIDKSASLTIKHYDEKIPNIGDLRKYSVAEILEIASLKKEEVDLIVGGPPCQAFSTAGRRQSFQDERGNLLLEFVNLILEINPKYAVIENVRGLLSAPLIHIPHAERGGKIFTLEESPGAALNYIVTKLKKAGYGVSFNLYNAANFGCPQTRERVIIICNRDGDELPYLEPTHSEHGEYGLPHWKTFREAVTGLSNDSHDYINFTEKELKFLRLLKPGQNWKNLPADLQPCAMGKSYHLQGGKTGFYRRLDWDKPAPTLVTHPARPATCLAHPELDRPLSIQEYKRLQDYDDAFFIGGTLLNQYKQLGNAVPLSLGKAIGSLILKHHKGEQINKFPNFPYSRYLNCDHLSWQPTSTNFEPQIVQLSLF